ncbi:siderophore-interacting protein [Mucilaginibacter sp. BJC16-A38]|uniref:SIP domain-containing protein n=1 Tax=Mucilaginibacter phenanthrenivorans TaxID=1234842 RepID=UPI0021584603|nr:SIP domain-containing protein [Mucilaginibacter phenanthrenivorans]MCR8560616.1 siderophore-interacting protein [Mucilaginibacter phenanthrenivorans]
MNTLILNSLKKKASLVIENRVLKTALVLEVRKWPSSNIIEIDLHMPFTSMHNWNEVNYIKCKVADFTYRDYTPSGWDAETQTCTLFVDAGHNGPGSIWASQLTKGDELGYLQVKSTRQTPVNTSAVICLGDESSIGHILAMQQLAMPAARFSGAVLMGDEHSRSLFNEYFRTPLQPVLRNDVYGHHSLTEWLLKQSYNLEHTIFYLTGNNTMVSQLRKTLKQQGYGQHQIKAEGFWS